MNVGPTGTSVDGAAWAPDALDRVAGQLPVPGDRAALRNERRTTKLTQAIGRVGAGDHRNRFGYSGGAGRPGDGRNDACGNDDCGGDHDLQGAKARAAGLTGAEHHRGRLLDARRTQCADDLLGAAGEAAARRAARYVRVEQRGLELGELAVGTQGGPEPGALTP